MSSLEFWSEILPWLVALLAALLFLIELNDVREKNWNVSKSMIIKLLLTFLTILAGFASIPIQMALSVRTEAFVQETSATALRLQNELQVEKDRIRTLTAVINVKVSGAWNDGIKPFREDLAIGPPEHQVFLELIPKTGIPDRVIKMFGIKHFSFREIALNRAIFIVEVSVKAGDWPLGENLQALRDIMHGVVSVPFLGIQKPGKIEIQVNQIIIELKANERVIGNFVKGGLDELIQTSILTLDRRVMHAGLPLSLEQFSF